jgi:hypothetical protein
MNETTKQTPFNLLIRGLPTSHYPMTEEQATEDDQMDHIHEMRSRAQEAIAKAQDVMKNKKGTDYKPYQEQDQVWLEATNLKTTHPTAKLAPKRYGPFTIIKKISDVVFQLELPHQWKVHNVFHASLLTPYIETELHGQNFPEPPPEIIEGDPEFEVEQIVGSRWIGKKKSLQYKIRWKGYPPAHDSWEPAAQVHTPKLIKRFQKTKSSHQNNATINYQSASGIQSRPKALTPPRDCTSLTEAESSESIGVIDKDSMFGKRTRDTLTAQTGNYEWRSFSNKDKRKRQDMENIIIPPIFHINSCTMDNNENRLPPPLSIEELCNMDLSRVDQEKKVYDELLHVLEETYNDPARDDEAARNAEAGPSNPVEGPTNAPPPTTSGEDDDELEYEEDPRSKQTSPTRTENIHPGYPYRENIGDNDDLPKLHYSRPYLAAQADYVTGDPRI